jgi:hypothetical protein
MISNYVFSLCYLIKCWEDIVGKLDLGNGGGSTCGNPDTKSHNALLTEGRVKHTIST